MYGNVTSWNSSRYFKQINCCNHNNCEIATNTINPNYQAWTILFKHMSKYAET